MCNQKTYCIKTSIYRNSRRPQQYIEEYSYKNIPVHELPSHEVFEQYAKDKAVKPIGLSEREMYSFEIICIGSRMGILAVLSHLISDAWTFSLIISEIEEAYEHLKAGNTVQEENIDYIKYVLEEKEYLMSSKYKKDEIYWKEKYSDRLGKTEIKPGLEWCHLSGQTE